MAEQIVAIQKQQQLPIAEGDSSTGPKEPASITNIYYDCLEHIFDYLDLQSLMNVAGTCKRLKVAAAAKFNDDHGEKTVVLMPDELSDYTRGEPGICIEPSGIMVIGLKFCHTFLWSFGAKISRLFFHEEEDIVFESLEQDINKYCADTLKSLEFGYRHCKQTFSLENNPKPFQHVEKVGMDECDLQGQFANINTLFPNLRHLSLGWIDVDEGFSAVSIPQLEHLNITLTGYFNFGLKEATDMIKANPQLQELQFGAIEFQEVKLAELLDVISGNTSISKLTVRQEPTNANTDELMRLAAEHPLMVDLDLQCYRMTANDVVAFVCNLNSLQKFQFKLVDDSQYDALKEKLDQQWKIGRVYDEVLPVGYRAFYILER